MSSSTPSKRNLCVHGRHRLLDRGGSLRIGWPRAEKLYAGCDNFGALALAAVVLGLVLAYPQPSFNVDLASLLQVFLAALGNLAEDHDVVPVDPLLTMALPVGVGLVGRDRKARHRLPAGRKMPQFRVLTKMTYQSYSIQRHCFSPSCSVRRGLSPDFADRFTWSRVPARRPRVAASAPGAPSDLRSAM